MGENEIDKLLEQLRTEYVEVKPPIAQPQLNSVKSVNSININSVSKSDEKLNRNLDKLLLEVKADFEQQDIEQERQQQQKIAQEAQIQAQIQAEQIKKLEQLAHEWLKELEPLSTEGLWFDKFAHNYPSRLAAAVDYLQELNQE